MLMKDDKKNRATIIIASMKSKNGEDKMNRAPMNDGAEMEGDEKLIAAEEILKAIENKDKRMLAEALKSLIEMCSSDEEYSEDSEEKE
jgi:hypothetical protein